MDVRDAELTRNPKFFVEFIELTTGHTARGGRAGGARQQQRVRQEPRQDRVPDREGDDVLQEEHVAGGAGCRVADHAGV